MKQQLAMLALIIPTITVPIFTTTTQYANARFFDSPICNYSDLCTNSQGYNAGRQAAHQDFLSGSNSGNIAYPRIWSNDYCSGYQEGYSTESNRNAKK
jgi:hypothetical protein